MADTIEVEYHSYRWPQWRLAAWLAAMLICSVIVMGVFAQFVHVQNGLGRGRPWYFDGSLAVAVITVIFVLLGIILFNVRMLTPYFMFGFSSVLFVLWLTMLIGVGIGLFGNQVDVFGCDYCNYWSLFGTATIVQSKPGYTTAPSNTQTTTIVTQVPAAPGQLAKMFWGQLCSAYKTAFAFELIGIFLLTYMIFQAWDVYREDKLMQRTIDEAD